jgi:ABC-2 type transport system ATP-binding protein
MEILTFVGLEAFKDRRAKQLSGGMKQKLGLASALVTRPKVLLLDEPTTGVDPVTRQDFWQLLIRLVSTPERFSPPSNAAAREGEGVAVILSTPYMDEAARCHRVGFMRNGRMILEGTPSQLLSRLEGCILEVRGIPLVALRQAVEKIEDVDDIRAFGDKIHLRLVPGKAKSVIAALNLAFPRGTSEYLESRLVPPTLEDVFISLAASS